MLALCDLIGWWLMLTCVIDLYQVRMKILTRHRLRAIRKICRFDPYLITWDLYPTSLQMFFSFHKWTFEHFYPHLQEESNESKTT